MKDGVVSVKVFTHPTCTSCKSAVQLVERLKQERTEVVVEIVSLASKAGREEAQREGILSVPTVLVEGRRFVGVPRWEDLRAAVETARALGPGGK